MSSLIQKPYGMPTRILTNLIALAAVLCTLIWAPIPALILPLILVAAGMYFRGSEQRRALGTFLLCAGVVAAIVAAILSYGLNDHAGGGLVSASSSEQP